MEWSCGCGILTGITVDLFGNVGGRIARYGGSLRGGFVEWWDWRFNTSWNRELSKGGGSGGVGTEIGKTEEWGGRWKHGSAYTRASGRNWSSFSWLQKTILITSFPSVPLISSCNNGANNPTACNQCSNGYAYIGSSCVACSNGGCTGTGGNVSNPLGSLVCTNGANNPTACSTFAPTATLSANPSTLDKGQSATLSWNSTNATSCTGTGLHGRWPSPALAQLELSILPAHTTIKSFVREQEAILHHPSLRLKSSPQALPSRRIRRVFKPAPIRRYLGARVA